MHASKHKITSQMYACQIKTSNEDHSSVRRLWISAVLPMEKQNIKPIYWWLFWTR